MKIKELQLETKRDVAEIVIPTHKNSKLATCVAEYLLVACNDEVHANFDIGTLRGFVDFLITKRGYN